MHWICDVATQSCPRGRRIAAAQAAIIAGNQEGTARQPSPVPCNGARRYMWGAGHAIGCGQPPAAGEGGTSGIPVRTS
jgi:hypothetical protein